MKNQELINERKDSFANRRSEETNTFELSNSQWAYIPINPFADETELLEKLGLSSADCLKVDAYWDWGPDVAFVQVVTRSAELRRGVGLYARYSSNSPLPHLNVVAVVEDDAVSRPVFESVLNEIENSGILDSDYETLESRLVLI